MHRVHQAFSCAAVALSFAGACIAQEVGADGPDVVGESVASFGERPMLWTPCQEDPALSCGALAVPLDYHDPEGPSLEVSAIKAPATGTRRGSIFINPGGPGVSGVDLVLLANKFGLFAKLREGFDLVTFDPRGTGRSSEVVCEVTLDPAPARMSTPEAQARYFEETARRVVTSCRQQNGGLAKLVGTTNVARDLEVFRRALGEPELNYLGTDYGTILGAEYATQFPNQVRAMVLDGNVPASWVGDSLLEIDADGSLAAERAFEELDRRCHDDRQCPLQDAGLANTLDLLVAKLDSAPIVVADGVYDGLWLRQVVLGFLYTESRWPSIASVLVSVDAGNLSVLKPRQPEPLKTRVVGGLATTCSDSTTRRAASDYLLHQAQVNASSPRFGGVITGDLIYLCSKWPQAERVSVRTAPTPNSIVLLGNDFDSVTPLSWSRNMAEVLGPKARLVRYQGGGHGAYHRGVACIDDAINGYFSELKTPELGFTCPAAPLSFGPTPSARRTAATLSGVLQELSSKRR
jgi:pimeloyl-ACP methyl ester carboxylesterase